MPDFAESIANDLSLKPEEQIQQLLAEYAKSADALGISLADRIWPCPPENRRHWTALTSSQLLNLPFPRCLFVVIRCKEPLLIDS
jgi:hypothetical protein